MNYRHAFHAGNFADLVKHACLIAIVSRLLEAPEPLLLVDTHGGAGLYDLKSAEAIRSREAEAGIARLGGEGLPPALAALKQAVADWNEGGEVRTYPGSPALMLGLMRDKDSLVACELRDDDQRKLARMFKRQGGDAEALLTDGYVALARLAQTRSERLFALVDPPFERADDYVRSVAVAKAVLESKPYAALLIWLPIKDLETLDGFVRRLEAIDPPPTVVAETRLRPLVDPLRMNGCALVAINPPEGAEAEIEAVCAFVAAELGDAGGRANLWRL